MKEVWEFIRKRLEEETPVALLYVTGSMGSSPGRRGFAMAVTPGGELCGSVGGGIMEQGLVEEAKSLLRGPNPDPILKRQVHRKETEAEPSGLICSGEQTVALCPLVPEDLPKVRAIIAAKPKCFALSPAGLQLDPETEASDTVWTSVALETPEIMVIIGGGHVGLALSRVMSRLGFRVEVFDEREGLNTMDRAHPFADQLSVGSFQDLGSLVPEGHHVYVAVVTFGFEVDRIVMRQLLGRNHAYLGLMGSRSKLRQLFDVLREEGISDEALATVHAPIGLPIHSHTPEEIAISIAAEIIQVKNSEVVSPPAPSNLDPP